MANSNFLSKIAIILASIFLLSTPALASGNSKEAEKDIPQIFRNSKNIPIFAAALKGDSKAVEALLKKDSGNKNITDKWGRTPLHAAAWGGHTSVVKILLEKGGNIEAVDSSGRTSLRLAAEGGHVAVVKELLAHKARTDVVDKYGWTPLDYALNKHHMEIINLLEK
jgi:ankyrin repeat protein